MPELQIKRGTYAAITGVNPVLADGEMVLETDTLKIRAGDGTNTYTNLPILFSGTYQLSGDYATVGHTHISSDIINFNSGVSGLLPAIANSGDNRVLTSTGSSFGINAENNLTFDGSILSISGNFISETGNLNQLRFNTSLDDPNLIAGQLQWNSTEGTLDLGLSDTYTQHIGEELHYRVRNNTGSTLAKGTPVYASGLTPGGNNRIEVNLYTADGSIREVRFMGLMTEDLTDNGNNGYATHFGYIKNVDTRGDAATYGTTNKLWTTGEPAWNQGDILYVHPTVPGKLTKIEPKHSISVAIITNVASNGKLFVRPTSYGHLDDNHDVSVSGATNGQFLQYNSTTDYWVPSSSGNFSTLQVNGTGVSVSGHTHTSSQIIDFNSVISKTIAFFNASDNQPPSTNYATLDTRNSILVLDFDGGSTNEEAVFVGVIPEVANLSSGLDVRINWMATTATSGQCRWGVQFEKMTTDSDGDSFDTATEAHSTTNATAGIPTITTITATSIDSLASGDFFRMKIYRDASDTTNDTMVGDAELISVELRQVI